MWRQRLKSRLAVRIQLTINRKPFLDRPPIRERGNALISNGTVSKMKNLEVSVRGQQLAGKVSGKATFHMRMCLQ